jgi:superfamily I DNA/RNA helicase
MPKKSKRSAKEIDLTDEQRLIVNAKINECDCVLINAYAGTGKTSTLRKLAEALSDRRVLYICFNRETALHAKKYFPKNTDCRTIHSLAFSLIGGVYREKIGILRPLDIMRKLKLSKAYLAVFTIQGVERFLYSIDEQIQTKHMPVEASTCGINLDELVNCSRVLWELMQDKNSAVPMTHDGYLKIWAKTNPKLAAYDFIFLDESQDTNPVTLDVVMRQRLHKTTGLVFVGDTHQSIYSFRGSINAMEKLQEISTLKYTLTKSFRFNNEIATDASSILTHFKGDMVNLIGAGPTLSPNGESIIIGRTNTEVIDQAILASSKGHMIHFTGTNEGDNWDPYVPYALQIPLDILSLKQDAPRDIKSSHIRAFSSYEELVEHSKGGDSGVGADLELAKQVSLVEKYGVDLPQVISIIRKNSSPPDSASMSFSTSHRSKGGEWRSVQLLDDFFKLDGLSDDEIHRIMESTELTEEINLIYVAMTRAAELNTYNSDLNKWLTNGRNVRN